MISDTETVATPWPQAAKFVVWLGPGGVECMLPVELARAIAGLWFKGICRLFEIQFGAKMPDDGADPLVDWMVLHAAQFADAEGRPL